MILTKNTIANKININYWNFFPKLTTLFLTLLSFSADAMEKENDPAHHLAQHNQEYSKELPDEILLNIFNQLDEGRLMPSALFTASEIKICPIPINDFIAAGMVCHRWRKANLPMRGTRILSILNTKKLINLADYETIRDSGYTTLCLFSENLIPENVSFLDNLINITSLTLLPPKESLAYTLPVSLEATLCSQKPAFSRDRVQIGSKGSIFPNEQDPTKKYLRPDVIKNISALKNLATLILAGNNLSSDELQGVLDLNKLVNLDLTCNRPENNFLHSLSSLKNLRILKLLRVKIENRKEWYSCFKKELPNCSTINFG